MRVAVIGAGRMGLHHIRSIQRTGHDLTGIVCATLAETGETAEKLGTQARTLEDVLADPAIDGVVVATPTPSHHPVVMAAATAGKHVWCEKPLAASLPEAREMAEKCEEAGVRLDVGHVVRYFPAYARAREIVCQDSLGAPAVVRTSRYNAHPVPGDWMADEASSGGVIFDIGIHDFDWLRWTFGEVETVFARQVSGPRYAYAHTVLRFADGTIGYTDVSWAHTTFRTSFEISCAEGLISHDSTTERSVTLSFRSDVQHAAGIVVPSLDLTADPYAEQLSDWLDGRPARHTARDGIAAVAIAAAAVRSCRSGRPERPEEP